MRSKVKYYLTLRTVFSFVVCTFIISCIKHTGNGGTEQNPATISLWKDSVIGAIYNAATNTVAYGKPDPNGIYKIYISNADGANEQPLTYGLWNTNRHQWAEEWTPDGQYLFCYIEKDIYANEAGHTRTAADAIPGYGGYTDIWVLKRDGSQAWQLTNLPNDYSHGVIHGAISQDGKLFAWTERTIAPNAADLNLAAGGYVFKVADVSYTPQPTFTNIQTYKPGNKDAGGEVESISPDQADMLIYSTFESNNILATPLYKVNLQTGATTKLTTESFSQCPTYTPNGQHIVYMTGANCDVFPFSVQGSDWWIMNADGSNKRRLTYMNMKDHAQSENKYMLAGSLSFLSDTSFLGGVMVQPLGLAGKTVKVDFGHFVK